MDSLVAPEVLDPKDQLESPVSQDLKARLDLLETLESPVTPERLVHL
jgi:hypothetical protein